MRQDQRVPLASDSPEGAPAHSWKLLLSWILLGAVLATTVLAGTFAIIAHMHRVSSLTVMQTAGVQLPVTISFREALLSRGSVAKITNFSDQPLQQVTITCANAPLNKAHDFHFDALAPHELRVIGWHEGWDFSPGDTVTVSAAGYGSLTRIVQK